MISLDLDNVSLDYRLYGPASLSLRAALLRPAVGGELAKNEHDVITTQALKDVTLSLREGDRLGLIGHNGAGKSTLLRVMAGVYHPTKGEVHRNGRTRTLFDISLGMMGEATGVENVMIRGLLMGATEREVQAKLEEIIEFSELGSYVHMPLRTYSSGMKLRLAFAASTAFGADIVLMDEIFGVGDKNFYKKAQARLDNYVGESGIVVLASHSVELMRKMCTHVLWLDHGEVKGYGPVGEILPAYQAA